MPRLTLTVADPRSGERSDVLVEAPPGTTVGTLAGRLARRAQPPDLYVDGARLDPALPVERSALREGALVSLDDPSGCLTAEPPGVVEVRVCGGPGAGVVHRLAAGTHDVGADPVAAVRLADGPGRALSLTVSVAGAVTAAPAGDGVPRLEGEPLTAARDWRPGEVVEVGAVLLLLALPTPADAALEPSEDGAGLDYNRPPRLLPPVRQTRFTLPAPPRESDRRGLPVAMMVAPLGFAVVMAVATNQPRMLAFGLFSPVMLLASHYSSARQGRKSFRRQQAEYRERKERIEADARAALAAEQEARRRDCPDPATALLVAVGPRSRLWERRRHDPDHLLLRVGTADLPSEVTLEDPEQDAHRRSVVWQVRDVPVAIPLRERGVVGFAGRGDLPRALGRWAVAQAATLHSPADVSVYVLTDAAGRASWEWVRWLPHARPAEGQDTAVLLGVDADSVARRVAELVAMVDARRKALEDAGATALANPDVVVVLDGARRLRALPGMVQVLREGPAVGVYAVCLDADERLLPEECAAVVVEAPGGRVVVRQARLDVAEDVRPDLVSPAWAERLARALAPVRDVSGGDEDSALPASSRLLAVLRLEPPTAAAIRARWAAQPRSAEFVVGESYDGPFAIDLVRDGPHGLIAGTTGAGKSELLQTIVASLAVANRPDAMTFVLVDYKGGAAFSQCVRLPHTVGMVTDLDPHLVERALESLGAELRRREHLLAAAGAKDIGDYVRRLAGEPGLAPLPRLLIVIDEFASLVRDLPDFVTGLVNIAQRGRSLGIHLLLATQRPSGVVSPEIRANTNLRIALRVTDAAESTDVIDAPDAARISKATPGRAYTRLGHASLVPFQASRVGGRRPGTAAVADEPFVAELPWERLARPLPARPAPRAEEDEVTDLAALVDAISAASETLGLPEQHRPWLTALGDQVLLDDLPPVPPGAGSLAPAPYAVDDLPAAQEQRAAVIDLATFGHLVVAGAPRSGRSQALRTIAGSLARTHSCADVHLYGIDCGNGALLPLAALPHCGAVVQRTQVERATRLVTRLGAEVGRRQDLLAEGGFADVEEQRAAAPPEARLPHIVVLLDRWEGFTTTLGEVDGGRLHDELTRILREGASAGVHLVLAGDRSLLAGRIATMTEDKIALRLADRGDFGFIGLNPRKMPDDIPQGRGFRSETGIETQIALLSADGSGQGQAAALAEIAAAAAERDRAVPRSLRPFRVDTLPAHLTFADAWAHRPDDGPRPLWGLVGVGGDELAAVGADLAGGVASFLVAGPPKSGRSTVLLTMTRSFLAGGAQVVVAAPQRSPLRDLDGTPGVLAVLTGDDVAAEELAALLEAEGPLVVVVDDAEVLRECGAKDLLRRYVRTAGDRGRGIVVGGNASDVATGYSGWQVEVRKGRRGALLSPQDTMDGDLVGVRLPRSVVGQPVQLGRALVHLGDGDLLTVQVPAP